MIVARRQGPGRWLRLLATLVCLLQALLVTYILVRAKWSSSSSSGTFSFLRYFFPDHKFKHFQLDFQEVFHFTPVTLDEFYHAISSDTPPCFVLGTANYHGNVETPCECRDSWSGKYCDIPLPVKETINKNISIRSSARKIINSFLFNTEFDLLEVRMHELYDIVDVFLIGESNVTHALQPKPLRLFEHLQKGFLKQFQDKIVYVLLEEPSGEALKDGSHVVESFLDQLSRKGTSKLAELRMDDLFIYNDIDEIPSREVLAFLKFHDGYTVPASLFYRWSIFGFFWKVPAEKTRPVISAVTMDVLWRACDYQISLIRSGACKGLIPTIGNASEGPIIKDDWVIGSSQNPAGWHCSWCLPIHDIRTKLLSAPKTDYPRWGDYPMKTSLSYIQKLVKKGIFFDLSEIGVAAHSDEPGFAPSHIMKNPLLFEYLMEVPHYETSEKSSEHQKTLD